MMSQCWIGITLIDITPTGVTRGESKERDQNRNWETVLQVLGLRTQAIILEEPALITDFTLSKKTSIFGDFYLGSHNLWAFRFMSERNDVYTLDQLDEDFEQVPVILGLDETARFLLPIFHSYSTLKNIYFTSEIDINTV